MSDIVLVSDTNGVRTLTFNRPEKLNGWSPDMMAKVKEELGKAASDDTVNAVILTGNGKYYCAGVDFAGSLKPMKPSALKKRIENDNEELFNNFIDFPKVIIVAMNGPAIGACVTSATLCDAIICAESVTVLTPFKGLGLCPEGCSSHTFPKMFGEKVAKEILEGRKLSSKEALELGYAQMVVPNDKLLEAAQAFAEEWVASGKGRKFTAAEIEELHKVNRRESVELANCMLGMPFLNHMVNFSYEKSKWGPYAMFSLVRATRPLWSKL